MNLAFNFKNKLFWIQNFLPQNLYKQMYVDFIKNRNKLDFEKTKVNWPTFKEEVNDSSYSFKQLEDNQLEYFNKYHTFLRHQKFLDLMKHSFSSHVRKYKYGQHLTWHHDEANDRKYAATFYFNKTWNESWGGELMFKSEEGSGFIPVVGNSVVIIKTGLEHKANPNLKKTHPRLSIQTWINSS